MTEADWLSCTDPYALLSCLVGQLGFRETVTRLLGRPRDSAPPWPPSYHQLHQLAVAVSRRMADLFGAAAGRAAQVALIRDIFGNPFREVRVDPSWLRWNDGTVVKIARGIYDEGRFGDVPILHDALLDAGCDDEAILSHCREPAEHVRGCWVLDLLLDKKKGECSEEAAPCPPTFPRPN